MYNIICADDDKYMQILYQTIFADRGNKVRLFSDCNSIFEAYFQEPADLVILDIDMPGKSGLELCSEFRKNPETFHVPIILVSAHDSEETIGSGLSAGADDYIIKPFKPGELCAKSDALVKNRNLSVPENKRLGPGCQIAGRYEIIQKIGSGGFSSVFLAQDTRNKISGKIAIKLFEVSHLKEEESKFMAIFLREAYGLSKLENPNIVKLLDFGHANGYYFLAMEYIEGKTLQEIVEESGPIAEIEVIVIAYEISKALKHMDKHKIVHRDIKPINLMLLQNGDVKVIDFGMARNVKNDTITMDGIFKGTPQYAAPEVIRSDAEIDIRADIFSLGATLYYLVSARKPFLGENPYEVFQNRLKDPPESILKVYSAISFQFGHLIDKMLSADREKRPSLEKILATCSLMISKM